MDTVSPGDRVLDQAFLEPDSVSTNLDMSVQSRLSEPVASPMDAWNDFTFFHSVSDIHSDLFPATPPDMDMAFSLPLVNPELAGTALLSDFSIASLNEQHQQTGIPFGDLIPVLYEGDPRLNSDIANFSSICLSSEQFQALNLSVKFRSAPTSVPYLQLAASAECAARDLDEIDATAASDFRLQCVEVIRKANIPKSNFEPRFFKALTTMGQNTASCITKSDKGG